MVFVDENHEEFYNNKLEQMQRYKERKADSYEKALLYTLGIAEETRKHFNQIFNIEKQEINIDSIQEPWQTGSSLKVTRMAFNLFNGCKYDSTQDIDNNEISKYYNVDEIFCCTYANYFMEAIKIRYPEYLRENDIGTIKKENLEIKVNKRKNLER